MTTPPRGSRSRRFIGPAAAADEITRRLEAFGTRQVWQPETLNVNGLLRRMARLIESAAGSRVRVAIRPSPGAGQVKAVLAQMESAILNLVTHACDVMQQGGQLLIDTGRVELPHNGHAEQYVMLAMTYSASEPEIERLFDPGLRRRVRSGSGASATGWRRSAAATSRRGPILTAARALSC